MNILKAGWDQVMCTILDIVRIATDLCRDFKDGFEVGRATSFDAMVDGLRESTKDGLVHITQFMDAFSLASVQLGVDRFARDVANSAESMAVDYSELIWNALDRAQSTLLNRLLNYYWHFQPPTKSYRPVLPSLSFDLNTSACVAVELTTQSIADGAFCLFESIKSVVQNKFVQVEISKETGIEELLTRHSSAWRIDTHHLELTASLEHGVVWRKSRIVDSSRAELVIAQRKV
jgi:hypothetical protein